MTVGQKTIGTICEFEDNLLIFEALQHPILCLAGRHHRPNETESLHDESGVNRDCSVAKHRLLSTGPAVCR